jgi:hypothetical protein
VGGVSDPLRDVWDALEAGGFGPHGQPHDFRSRCPGHDGDNRDSLHVSDGGGQALVWCFAHGCSVEEIVEPLGLRVRDLYPVDLGSGRRLRTARREDFSGNARTLANVLLALEQLGERWGLSLWLDLCPNCERQHLQLSINSTGDPRVYCGRGCDLRMFEQALADLVRGPRRRAA